MKNRWTYRRPSCKGYLDIEGDDPGEEGCGEGYEIRWGTENAADDEVHWID